MENQTTTEMKETANESENGPGQSTSRLTTLPRCDGSDEFVTRAYQRVFADNRRVLHVCLEFATKGTEQGGSR